jgi:hypothetical protein
MVLSGEVGGIDENAVSEVIKAAKSLDHEHLCVRGAGRTWRAAIWR